MYKNLSGLGRKTLDVVRQILRGLVGIALELLKVQLAGVTKGVPRDCSEWAQVP
jgi:hypothetical protein